jgi:hypothetical protein
MVYIIPPICAFLHLFLFMISDDAFASKPEPESSFEASMQVSYFSKYSGEGIITNPDPNLQGELSIGYAGFSAAIFGVLDLTDVLDYRYEFEELNYILGYEYSAEDLPLLGQITLGIAWTYFDIPRSSNEDYQELKLSLVFDDLPLTPGFSLNWDYENDTLWFTASGEHSLPLEKISDKLSWDSELILHWGNGRWVDSIIGVRKNALATAALTTGPCWAFNDYAKVKVFVELAWGLNSQVRDAMRNDPWNNSCNISGGISFEITW